MKTKLKPIAFLPWLELHREVTIGRVVFWPYEKMKDRNLPAEHPPETLDKYAAAFRTFNDDPSPVTCVSYKTDAPQEQLLTKAESLEFLRAQHILFAAAYVGALEKPNLSDFNRTRPSAEHFILFPFPYRSEDREDGSFILQYPRRLTFGIIDGLRLQPPYHLHHYTFRSFDPLLVALSHALRLPQNKSFRIWRALEWFFYSQTTQEHFTEESRLVLLCMAIEALIEGPGDVNRRRFVSHVGDVTRSLGLSNRRWKRKLNPKAKTRTLPSTILEAWAYDFYESRNALVHPSSGKNASVVWRRMRFGGKLSGYMHDFLAAYVWFECLWDAICGLSLVPPKPTKDASMAEKLNCAKWYMAWQLPLDHMREWWSDFLNGKILPPNRNRKRRMQTP